MVTLNGGVCPNRLGTKPIEHRRTSLCCSGVFFGLASQYHPKKRRNQSSTMHFSHLTISFGHLKTGLDHTPPHQDQFLVSAGDRHDEFLSQDAQMAAVCWILVVVVGADCFSEAFPDIFRNQPKPNCVFPFEYKTRLLNCQDSLPAKLCSCPA